MYDGSRKPWVGGIKLDLGNGDVDVRRAMLSVKDLGLRGCWELGLKMRKLKWLTEKSEGTHEEDTTDILEIQPPASDHLFVVVCM